ncbi:MAG: PKD domain-containing protein [Pyrinomonadaceae bacterium]
MPLNNLDYYMEHLPWPFRRDDQFLLLRRFMSYFCEQLDGFDEKLETFYQKIAPSTAPEQYIEWFMWSFFGWGWFPEWFMPEQKREFYRTIAFHYARRGTALGIKGFLAAFGIQSIVTARPTFWGQFAWGEPAWMINGPLGIVIQILPIQSAAPSDLSFYGDFAYGEGHYAVTPQTLPQADIEELVRFVWPLSQTIILDFPTTLTVQPTPPLNQLPTAAFNITVEDMTGIFDAQGSSDPDGSIVEYMWNFGDGNHGSGAQTSRTYVTPGTYSVALTVKDNQGQMSTVVNNVTVAPFVPTNIAGLQTWLAADLIIGVDGAALASWNDVSGAGHHATQAIGAEQPIYHANIDGHAAVSFDRDDDFLNLPSLTSGTVFVVAKNNNSVFPWYLGLFNGNGESEIDNYFVGSSGESQWHSTPPPHLTRYVNAVAGDNIPALNQWNIYTARETWSQTLAGYVVGRDRHFAGRSWDGHIREVIVYSGSLSSHDMQRVHGYLSSKYGIPLS